MTFIGDLEWLLVAIYLQEQQTGTKVSFDVERVHRALKHIEATYRDVIEMEFFLGRIPRRHYDDQILLRALKRYKNVFSEQKGSENVPTFSLTEQGREVGLEDSAYLPPNCARLVGEEFEKIISGGACT